jgi:hypothetical protein
VGVSTKLPKTTIVPRKTPTAPSTGAIVLSPELITSNFDALRFDAAAFEQLRYHPTSNEQGDVSSDHVPSTLLISSPYNEPGHYLDLATLDLQTMVFAKALTALKPERPDYATAPYTEALNFEQVLSILRNFAASEKIEWKRQTFYVVIFRSKLKEVIDADLLYQVDYESHGEACASGNLLKYWFGGPDAERRNLATCEQNFFLF